VSLFSGGMERAALISDDGLYRYRLSRSWGSARPMTFVMLNPSTADGLTDDNTIRKCIGFAGREGAGGIDVVNLFALRVSKPVHLFDGTIAEDPEGPDNLFHVQQAIEDVVFGGGMVVCGWGAKTGVERSTAHAEILSLAAANAVDFRCLVRNANGSPKHPLYIKNDQPLVDWP
jgi:hypothetical protein